MPRNGPQPCARVNYFCCREGNRTMTSELVFLRAPFFSGREGKRRSGFCGLTKESYLKVSLMMKTSAWDCDSLFRFPRRMGFFRS
jgi:hypothetical protein